MKFYIAPYTVRMGRQDQIKEAIMIKSAIGKNISDLLPTEEFHGISQFIFNRTNRCKILN